MLGLKNNAMIVLKNLGLKNLQRVNKHLGLPKSLLSEFLSGFAWTCLFGDTKIPHLIEINGTCKKGSDLNAYLKKAGRLRIQGQDILMGSSIIVIIRLIGY